MRTDEEAQRDEEVKDLKVKVTVRRAGTPLAVGHVFQVDGITYRVRKVTAKDLIVRMVR